MKSDNNIILHLPKVCKKILTFYKNNFIKIYMFYNIKLYDANILFYSP